MPRCPLSSVAARAAAVVLAALLVPSGVALAQTDPGTTAAPTTPSTTVPPPTIPIPPAPPAAPGAPSTTSTTAPPVLPDPSGQIRMLVAQSVFDAANEAATAARAAEAAAAAAERQATDQRNQAREELAQARAALAVVAVNAYVSGGAPGARQALTLEQVIDAFSGQLALDHVTTRALDTFSRAKRTLADRERALATAHAEAVATHIDAVNAQSSLDAAAQALATAKKAAARMGSPGSDLSPTVLGSPLLTADDLVAYYRAEGWKEQTTIKMEDLAKLYLSEGAAEGVRADVAFAQSMLETGAFDSPLAAANNFAGIGACDSCADGWHFDSAQDGVRAQMQMLHGYADKTLTNDKLANPPVSIDLSSLTVKGCCPTWNKLPHRWASDPNYAAKVLSIYRQMLAFTASRHPLPALPG